MYYATGQVQHIISEYVGYYNTKRMHQGINKIPDAEFHESVGPIKNLKILSGLHHHYFCSST